MNNFKILIVGVTGMLGHSIFKNFFKKYDTFGICRSIKNINNNFFDKEEKNRIIESNNIFQKINEIIEKEKINILINCIAVINVNEKNLIEAIDVNSKFPHTLYKICEKEKIHFINFSTDAVFDDNKHIYHKETDNTVGKNLYSSTKLLGEIKINYYNTLIRCCPIGFEISSYKKSLLSWIIGSKDKEIEGYKNVIFNGITIQDLIPYIEKIIINKEFGVIHISSTQISKYELINKINNIFKLNIKIKINLEKNIIRLLKPTNNYFNNKSWDLIITDLYKNYLNNYISIYENN